MRITKRQLTKLIREAQQGSTEKYDDDSALTGDQDELPDGLQKGIIDKTVEDREESNVAYNFGLNEGMKELEMELIDDIVELLASNGVIRPDADDSYDEALYWVESALIPALQDMVDTQAGRNPGGSIG